MPTRILLTGATGFVGSHALPHFLQAGCTVRALVRSEARGRLLEPAGVEVIVGSLEDRPALMRATEGCDVVVHLAALTHARSDSEFFRVNEGGTADLLHAALGAGSGPRRFVYLSSLAAVGPAVAGRPVDAETRPRPLTMYGRSKLAGERACKGAAGRMEVAILRAPAVYGPRDTDMYHFFRLASRGVMPVPTGPERSLQLVHADDLARALVHAALAFGADGTYHVAEAQAYTWRGMGKLMADALGRRVRQVPVPAAFIAAAGAASETVAGLLGRSSIFSRDKARELLAPGWLCETERAREELGFQAVIPLAEGFRTTARWYRTNGWL